jgi:hypothetical protein
MLIRVRKFGTENPFDENVASREFDGRDRRGNECGGE